MTVQRPCYLLRAKDGHVSHVFLFESDAELLRLEPAWKDSTLIQLTLEYKHED